MSFWKTLGKIGSIAAPIIAAPFTGGATLALIGAGAGAANGALSGGGLKGALLGGALGGATAGLAGGGGGAAAGAAAKGGTQMGLGSALGSIGKTLIKPENLATIGGILGDAAKGSAGQRVAEAPGMTGAYNANLNAQHMNDRRAMLASLLGGTQDAAIGRPENSTIPTFALSGGMRPSNFSNRDALMQQLGTSIKPLDMPDAGMMEKVMGGVGLGTSILGALGGMKRSQTALSGPTTPGNAADPTSVFSNVRLGGMANGIVDPRSSSEMWRDALQGRAPNSGGVMF